MQKKIALLAVVLIGVGTCSSVVSALPSMGPPKALIGQDQWNVGLGYSYSQMDLEASGRSRESAGDDPPGSRIPNWALWLPSKHDIKDLTSNMVLGQVGYGVSESLDVFLCVGLSDAQDDMKEVLASGASAGEYSGLDGGFGFAWGLGARATFWQDGDVTWGGMAQVIWENPRDGDISFSSGDPFFADPLTGDAELDLREIQVAVGPTVQLEGLSIYGGPFLHFVKGDVEISVSGIDAFDALNNVELSEDIREESELGVYAGLQGEADAETSWYAEYRITGDAWGVGIGAVRRFR